MEPLFGPRLAATTPSADERLDSRDVVFCGSPKTRLNLAGFSFLVGPAWEHFCGCKSRRKLIMTNEAERNCVRATGRGQEAWSVSCEPMGKSRVESDAEQGEWAMNRKALVIKAKWRKSGGCVAKERGLTWVDLALCLKGRRC